MRWFEISSGFNVTVSNEESDLVDKIKDENVTKKKDLDDREKQVANKLVSKGVVNRLNTDDDNIGFQCADEDILWRD